MERVKVKERGADNDEETFDGRKIGGNP